MNTGIAGRYKLTAIKPDGSKRELSDWFPNLITDIGLERMGVGAFITTCVVGSGNATPQFTDSQLQSRVASTTTIQTNSYASGVGAPDYYCYYSLTFRFPIGAAAGNLSEVGVGWSSSSLFSRALILGAGNTASITGQISSTILTVTAVTSGTIVLGMSVTGTNVVAGTRIVGFGTGTGGTGTYIVQYSQTVVSTALSCIAPGSPTTITVLSDEILDVTYEVRLYHYNGPEILGSIDLDGVTYYTKMVGGDINYTSFEAPGIGATEVSPPPAVGVYNGVYSSSNLATAGGSSSNSTSVTALPYVPGSKKIGYSAYFNTTAGNLSGFITQVSFGFRTRSSSNQITYMRVGFFESDYVTPKPIPKDNTKTLTLSFEYSWDRR